MDKRIMLTGVILLAFPLAAQAQADADGRVTGGAAAAGSGHAATVEGGAGLSTTSRGGTPTGGSAAHADAILAAAIRSGLPEAPLRRVVAQGRARGASAAEIERAARTVRARLEASSRALSGEGRDGAATAAEIEAGAEALARGARTEDLERLRDAAPSGRSLVVPLSVLAELSASGTTRGGAAADLAARVRAGASDAALSRMASNARAAATLPGGARSVSGVAAAGGVTGTVSGSAGLGILR